MADTLLVGLHGFTETGERFRRYSGIAEIAANLNLPYLCPNAAWFRNWAHWPRPWRSADERMLCRLHDVHGRLILLGFSDGANMAHTFALKHPDKVAAVVVYAGRVRTPERSIDRDLHRRNKMLVLLLRNTNDRLVPDTTMVDAFHLYNVLGHDVETFYPATGGHTWNRAANARIEEVLREVVAC